MRDSRNLLQGLKPVLLMVLVQIFLTVANLLNKMAISDGMHVPVITAYRFIFGTVCTLPLALLLERKSRPLLTWRVLFMSFLCGLFGGALFQNLYFSALALISATFAVAIYNLVPTITFILAILCGLEKLKIKTAAGMVVGLGGVLGTVVGLGGSMLLTFFKGAQINIWTFHINLLHHNQHGHVGTPNHDHTRILLGVLCGFGSCFSFSIWLIIQAKMSKKYPSDYSGTTLMILMGAIQSTAFALCFEKDWSQWKLGWNIRTLNAAYSGIVGLLIIAIAWCVRMRGPVFASAFNPLCLVLVAVPASMFLDENLYVGSVIGGALIVCGLYLVLWGKSKETKKVTPLVSSELEEATNVVVMSTAIDHDNSDYNNNRYRCND